MTYQERVSHQFAVSVRNACKHYGYKKDRVAVLNGLNLSVPKGVIYGLLGASGCGKTTLLNCILGRRALNSGEIRVFGETPSENSSFVLCHRFGYMPQDVALCSEFTAPETLTFYGRLLGMTEKKIKERREFLISLLLLPSNNQLVKTFSRGQQRRLSLASALIHNPDLLVLDEPTVGLDCELRKSIWNYLLDLSRENGTTVIITSHYIDETRHAHLVAFMRRGCIIAKDSPNNFLERYGVETLEAVFYILSGHQDESQRLLGEVNELPSLCSSGEVIPALEMEEINIQATDNSEKGYGDKGSKLVKFNMIFNENHMKALMWKNWIYLKRNIVFTFFALLFPLVQCTIFCLCFGTELTGLTIAVANYEANNSIVQCQEPLACNSLLLSCHFLKYIDKNDMIMVYYSSEEAARQSVLEGKTYASIFMHYNFSLSFQNRVKGLRYLNEGSLIFSQIEVFKDVSNIFVEQHIRKTLNDAFAQFLEDYTIVCNKDKKSFQLPMKFEDPVYGIKNQRFVEFVAPGFLISFITFIALALTCMSMMIERSESILERFLVLGVNRIEILLSHLAFQSGIMIIQSITVIVCLFPIYNLTMKGSLWLFLILTIWTGFCGMLYGICISSVCNSAKTAFHVSIGSFIPVLALAGVFWPLEGMHPILLPIANILPFTAITESLRSIMLKGWGFSKQTVYTGFVSVGLWMAVFIVVSVLSIRLKKS